MNVREELEDSVRAEALDKKMERREWCVCRM